MLYSQDVSGCLAGQSGHGITGHELDALLTSADEALLTLRQMHKAGSLPVLRLPQERGDLDEMRSVADFLLKDTSDLIICGVGGSSLGAQALAQLAGYGVAGHQPAAGPRIHFFDNLDPLTYSAALETLDLKTTRFLLVSKSGSTAETMMQALAAVAALQAAGAGKHLKHHFAAITTPGDNPLRRLAETHGFAVLDHDPKVGGRFSVLSNVGLLPAMLFGLDPVKVRQGAAQVFQTVLDGAPVNEVAPALGAAIAVGLNQHHGTGTNVLMSYSDKLELFTDWYAQLWGESLGKDGKGTVPYGALGPVDQHSQLQLYLGGPNDKFHTIIMTESAGKGLRIDAATLGDDDRLGYIAGKTMGDLVDAQQRATADTLIRNKRPTRVIKISEVSEETLGALMMHFMLETIIAAHLMGVEPFDQPAVEEGKVLARQYLGEL
jgi:glucose-6-phosphate isomerase